MKRIAMFAVFSAAMFSGTAVAQTARPAFQIADVHVSAPSMRNQGMQGAALVGTRYEIRKATMLDLIKTAYNMDADLVVGGPSWLEWDRFDILAKAPAGTPPATLRLMLQSLLADRFKVAVHRDTRPVQGFVLSMGKGQHKLKQATGSGEPGCQSPFLPPPENGVPPPQVFSCHGVTMEEFASLLRNPAGGYLTGPVLDSTGLKGSWDFDLRFTIKVLLNLAGPDGINLFDAIDRQLGMKLEPGKVPMPVLVVDAANQKPSPNSPQVATELPPSPPPQFEVASVRLSGPGTDLGPPPRFLPGGRYEAHGFPMWIMIDFAWGLPGPGYDVPGMPKWLTLLSPLVDIVAKVPESAMASSTQLYADDQNAMLRSLLADRFKMKAHYEDRPMDAYTLVADKPKLKAADPSSRSWCRAQISQAPRDPSNTSPPPLVATCQNVTMTQFAERLSTLAPSYLRYPVLDATGIQGSWDINVSFSGVDPNRVGSGGGRGGGGKGPSPAAVAAAANGPSDPVGGVALFDALEKQLGLKLEKHQRPEPVLVIDHVEPTPTEN